MDAQLKAKWVEALRSGEYKQADRCLRDEEDGSLCCLGVLATIQDARWESETPYLGETRISHDEGGWLNERFAGGLPLRDQQALARMNDSEVPFEKIADYIEQNL